MCCGSVTDWRLQRPSGRRWCGRSDWTLGRCDTSPRPFTSWSRPTAWKLTRQRYNALFLTSLNVQHLILNCCIVRLNVWPFCTCSWATCWPGARWPPAWPCPTSPGSILPIHWRPSLPSEFSDHTLRYCQQQTLCLLISLSQCTNKLLSLQHEFLFFMMWPFEYIEKRLIYNVFFFAHRRLCFSTFLRLSKHSDMTLWVRLVYSWMLLVNFVVGINVTKYCTSGTYWWYDFNAPSINKILMYQLFISWIVLSHEVQVYCQYMYKSGQEKLWILQ